MYLCSFYSETFYLISLLPPSHISCRFTPKFQITNPREFSKVQFLSYPEIPKSTHTSHSSSSSSSVSFPSQRSILLLCLFPQIGKNHLTMSPYSQHPLFFEIRNFVRKFPYLRLYGSLQTLSQ